MTKAEVPPELRIENLDHLGIVAGICDRIGLVERVNERLGTSPDEFLSSGQVLKAMILNGLGFLSAPMYLFSRFFEGKPTEHLLGEGVKPEHLNDDKLARVLDKLYEAGLTSLFVEVALRAANQEEGVKIDRLHLDATSFGVHGRYLSEQEEEEEEEEPEPIHITYGYSRDRRPDLKQFLVDLMVSAEGGVPVFLRVADGNESEAAVFGELIVDYRRHVDLDALFVADAALYNEENLKLMGGLRFVSRVPQTIKRAKDLLETPDREEEGLAFSCAKDREGYRVAEVQADYYAGLKQRWVVLESDKRAQGDLQRLQKRLEREHEEALKALKALGKRLFGCERDAAREAANKLEKGLRYHRLMKETMTIKALPYHAKPGRPRQDAPPPDYRYRVEVEGGRAEDLLAREEAQIAKDERKAGRFILATSVLDEEALPAEEVLETYLLGHQVVERGFRFLKDPMFFAASVFLKTPKRVAALAMVMGLCLLVYSLAERELRRELAQSEASIPDQLGRPTRKPTLRWVFQLFQAVHLVDVMGGAASNKLVHGLTEERKHILTFFSPECRRNYLLA